MKKIALALTLLLLTSQAWAGITVTAAPGAGDDCNLVTISYEMDGGDPNLPRAFALDISVDSGATIDLNSVSDLSADFWVHPGSIDINEATGVVEDNGTPVADSTSSSIIIEMGSLYKMGVDPNSAADGNLISFRVVGDCNVMLAEDAARGGVDSNGVVMEDTTDPLKFPKSYVKLDGCTVICEGEPPPRVCMFDIVGATTADPPDDKVDGTDMLKVSGMLNEAYFWSGMLDPPARYVINKTDVVPQIQAIWHAGCDIVGNTTADPPDDKIDGTDLLKLSGMLNEAYFWSGMLDPPARYIIYKDDVVPQIDALCIPQP